LMASKATFALNSGENFLLDFMTTKIKILNLTCCPNLGGNYI